jgi:hypothetical protein
MVARLHTKLGFNEPSARTKRMPDCCRRNMGRPFFLALASALTARIEIGRGPSTTCGQTSTIASVSSRRRLLALARRRMPSAKRSSMSKPLVPARRLLLALARR